MTTPSKRPANAGGFVIAAAVIVGTGIGVAKSQPSLGFLLGLAVGVAIAVALWLMDRR